MFRKFVVLLIVIVILAYNAGSLSAQSPNKPEIRKCPPGSVLGPDGTAFLPTGHWHCLDIIRVQNGQTVATEQIITELNDGINTPGEMITFDHANTGYYCAIGGDRNLLTADWQEVIFPNGTITIQCRYPASE